MNAALRGVTSRSNAFDVIIVGGGAAGTCAAVALGRRGISTALIDLHDAYPSVFRAEKVAGEQIALMRRLDILEAVAGRSAKIQTVLNTRAGKVLDCCSVADYGLPYEDLVNVLRPLIGPSVTRFVGRVADVQAGPDRQRVTLSDGRVLEGRLIVLATGSGEMLKRNLGIMRETLRPQHSISIGFDALPRNGNAFGQAGLTCYGNAAGDCIDYVTVFPFQRGTRVNIFVYRNPRDSWLGNLKDAPAQTLFATLPGFARFLGDFDIAGDMHMRPTGIYVSRAYHRHGVVLIGDAFCNVCPSVGRGLTKVFTDVDRLCNAYLPQWLETPGMSAEKIAAFYDDPHKQASDAESLRSTEYRRAVTMEPGLKWRVHRHRVHLEQRTRGWLAELTRRSAARQGQHDSSHRETNFS